MATGFSVRTAQMIIDRDKGKCFRCGELVDLSARGLAFSLHHRRPRGAGGTSLWWVNLPSNGVLLCGSGTTGDHGWVERNRHEARELGYLVPLNGILTPSQVPIVRYDGALVYLTDDGQAEPSVVPVGEMT